MLAYHKERAKGGVALLISEDAYIDTKTSQSTACQLGAYDDRCIPGLAILAETIKEGGARACLQLMHSGRQRFLGSPMAAPSSIPWEELLEWGGGIPKELTIEEIEVIVEAFGEAAGRAKQAGFDMVEVHGAHGYLITNFLSRHTNKRADWYGGSLENRMRFPLKVVESIRGRVGRDFPLGIRITADEYEDEGITLDESKIFAKRLVEAGIDVIHVSAGNLHTTDRQTEPMYYPVGAKVHLAEAIKKVVGIPIIASGSITTPQLAEKILEQGKADFVSLGRPLVADPHFVKKVMEGRPEDIVPCIRCLEGCILRGVEATRGLKCTVNIAVGKEEEYPIEIERAKKSRNIAVVGGGPAGMEAARVAALRGHNVTLYEKRGLGGQMLDSSVPEFKKDVRGLLEYFKTQLDKLNVTVIEKEATAETIEKEDFDAVIVATGSSPAIPLITGVNRSFVVTALDVLRGKDIGKEVIVIGGGLIGCETALFLAERGKKVTLVEMEEKLIPDGDVALGMSIPLMKGLQKNQVEIHLDSRLEEITDDGITIVNKYRKKDDVKGDTVVLAVGMTPNKELAKELKERKIRFIKVGDCLEARKLYDAIHEGHLAARGL
jgi:2,4-dienoyl-CoA reductase-like NADH-dependent reductase (Old Yellow Enzyme family)/thioredoxin reductase